MLIGNGFDPSGNTEGVYVNTDFKGWKLKSRSSAKQHHLKLILNTEQVKDYHDWFEKVKIILSLPDDKNTFAKTQQWWQQFWNRSFIRFNRSDTSSVAWKVGRNFQLFRYMLPVYTWGFAYKIRGGLFKLTLFYK